MQIYGVQDGRPTPMEIDALYMPFEARAKFVIKLASDAEFQAALGRVAAEGEIYYNTTTHKYRYKNNTIFVDI